MDITKYLQIPYTHLGRDFLGCDCFGLVHLFYKEELGIHLPNFTNYQEKWHLTDASLIVKTYRELGFEKVSTFSFGDAILFKDANYLKHVGVVIDDGYFLHTTNNGTYCHQYLQGDYINKIDSTYRYTGDK